jgi:hypothetical protein
VPVVGWFSTRNTETDAYVLPAFRRGLNTQGYVEGRNVTIEYRWSDTQNDRLPALAADLVRRQVAVLVATGNAARVVRAVQGITTAFRLSVPQSRETPFSGDDEGHPIISSFACDRNGGDHSCVGCDVVRTGRPKALADCNHQASQQKIAAKSIRRKKLCERMPAGACALGFCATCYPAPPRLLF